DLKAQVGEAANAGEALQQMAVQAWDLVLLDISLPGRSGLDLLPELRATWPHSKVIIISSFDDQQFAVRAFRDGAQAFLTKERAPRELMQAIEVVLGGRRYITADLAEQMMSLLTLDAPRALHESLSSREFEVFRLMASAKSPKEIAWQLDISAKTVSTYRTRILEKMGMTSNVELMQYAVRHGLVV
ncbi:MAG: response regulator transcription factor, partial [Sterolibacterium sp.]|nr:response regulator transcription factor [Sterolibacterium sp.]